MDADAQLAAACRNDIHGAADDVVHVEFHCLRRLVAEHAARALDHVGGATAVFENVLEQQVQAVRRTVDFRPAQTGHGGSGDGRQRLIEFVGD